MYHSPQNHNVIYFLFDELGFPGSSQIEERGEKKKKRYWVHFRCENNWLPREDEPKLG